jgi:hypothetical protein
VDEAWARCRTVATGGHAQVTGPAAVLDRILGRIPIAEDPSCDRVQTVVCGGREGIECLVVAPLCAFDEFGRHADSSV